MAFEAADKIAIARITGLSVIDVDLHLLTFVAVISPEIEAAVADLLLEYQDLPNDDGIEIFPNEANFGARVKNARELAENRIKNTLYGLLSLPRFSAAMTMLERG